MPRQARKESGTGIYHVMLRGINRQDMYAIYYNQKYSRSGHLFQDRFKSEPVNDMPYFVTLLRYIHQNPTKAGIVSKVGDYDWSSWKELSD